MTPTAARREAEWLRQNPGGRPAARPSVKRAALRMHDDGMCYACIGRWLEISETTVSLWVRNR